MHFVMKRRFVIVAGLAVVTALAVVGPVRADVFVGTGTVRTSIGGATSTADVNIINGETSLGNGFFNNTTTNASGGVGTVRIVGSDLLSTYGFQFGGGTGVTYNGLPVVAVYALDGSIGGGSTVFQATSGRVGFFSIQSVTTYNQFNPITWGATTASGQSLLTPLAVWDLKPAEAVKDLGPGQPSGGGPGIFNLTPTQVNQISSNALVPTSNQGFLLFRENATFTTLEGPNFINVTGNAPMPPAGFLALDEALVSRLDESYRVTPVVTFISGGPGFDALNTIAAQLGGLSDLDAALPGSQAFANAFGGVGNSAGDGRAFNPSNGNPSPNTGDLYFSVGITSAPGVQANDTTVPEPASITLLISGSLAAGAFVSIRRRRH